MNKTITLLYLFLFTMLVACKDHECPDPITTVVLKNTDISDVNCNSAFPSALRGSDGRIQTSAWTFSSTFGATRTFMNFDLSSIPADATILKAVLTLYADTTNYTNPTVVGHSNLTGTNEWKIKRITSAWAENTITWDTKPSFDDIGAISMPASTSNAQTYRADITAFLNDQLHNPGLYFGVMFQLDTEIQYRQIAFCSKEHPYAATLMPTLKITYKK